MTPGWSDEGEPTYLYLNGRALYRVAWSRQRPDGKRRQAESPALSRSDANHWRSGDEIAAYIHPSDREFAEADSDIGHVAG